MSARVLTNEEYAKLAAKLLNAAGRDMEAEGPAALRAAAVQLKQAHRLLCEGRNVDDLTPVERFYASAFKGRPMASVHFHDGSWEPAIEVADLGEPPAEPKPKKKEK